MMSDKYIIGSRVDANSLDYAEAAFPGVHAQIPESQPKILCLHSIFTVYRVTQLLSY